MKDIDFYNKMRDEVAFNMPELDVKITEVTKNNGLKLHGLVASRKDSKVSPTIYMENFHQRYEDGCLMNDLVNEMIELIRTNKGEGLDLDYFKDYERVKERIIFKVVNYDLNRELLEHIPYVGWNDLAIVFCHVCDEHSAGYATILIRNEHLEMWGVTKDELYKTALDNTPGLMKDVLSTMENVLTELGGAFITQDFDDITEFADNMYILSNKNRIFGASTMLYSRHLKLLANKHNSGLYILPSSIHEVIILPEDAIDDTRYMKDMIYEVNETQVSPEERLSDNLYYYDREKEEIRIA
jgi:hypothetical protein